MQVPSLTVGGPPYLWYQDLTLADPYYTLPILSSAIFLISIELNMADGLQVALAISSLLAQPFAARNCVLHL